MSPHILKHALPHQHEPQVWPQGQSCALWRHWEALRVLFGSLIRATLASSVFSLATFEWTRLQQELACCCCCCCCCCCICCRCCLQLLPLLLLLLLLPLLQSATAAAFAVALLSAAVPHALTLQWQCEVLAPLATLPTHWRSSDPLATLQTNHLDHHLDL